MSILRIFCNRSKLLFINPCGEDKRTFYVWRWSGRQEVIKSKVPVLNLFRNLRICSLQRVIFPQWWESRLKLFHFKTIEFSLWGSFTSFSLCLSWVILEKNLFYLGFRNCSLLLACIWITVREWEWVKIQVGLMDLLPSPHLQRSFTF